MKKKEAVASDYANKLIAYEETINMATTLINKYNGKLEEEKRRKTSLLYKKEESENAILELEKKIDKNKKIFRIIFIPYIIFGVLGPVLLGALKLKYPKDYFNTCYFIIYYSIYFSFDDKKESYEKEIVSIVDAMVEDEEQEAELDKRIAKLRSRIEKLERIKKNTKEKVDILREAFDQIEEQISLEEQSVGKDQVGLETLQEVGSQQVLGDEPKKIKS